MKHQFTVTFKYNIGDKVFIIYKGKAKQFPIYSMKCDVDKNETIKSVFLNVGKEKFECHIVQEADCFPTKQALIDSL